MNVPWREHAGKGNQSPGDFGERHGNRNGCRSERAPFTLFDRGIDFRTRGHLLGDAQLLSVGVGRG